MEHDEFISKLESGKIKLYVDEFLSLRAMRHGHIGKAHKYVGMFFSCTWMVGVIYGAYLIFKIESLLAGLVIVAGSVMIPGVLKFIASQSAKNKLIADPTFYEWAKVNGLFVIEEI